MNKRRINKDVEPLISTARDEFQVTKEFPLIVTLDTPTGVATAIAHYNKTEVITSDNDTKKLLEEDIKTRLKGNKRYVTIPWVENVSNGYYADGGGGVIPAKDRVAENILIYGTNLVDHTAEINHVAVTAWENSNYIVIGSHYGILKTDWSKYLFVPVMTDKGMLTFIVNPDSDEYMSFVKYGHNASSPFRDYALTDEVKTSEPPLVRHVLGVSKYMSKAKGLVPMHLWFNEKTPREAFLYQTPNHIFMYIDGVEYKAERVPVEVADMPKGLELYNIHTHKLTACIGVQKGYRKARAIVSVKVRYVDTGLTKYEAMKYKIGRWLRRNIPRTVGGFMGIDFKLVNSPVSLSSLNYDIKAELAERYSKQSDLVSILIG